MTPEINLQLAMTLDKFDAHAKSRASR